MPKAKFEPSDKSFGYNKIRAAQTVLRFCEALVGLFPTDSGAIEIAAPVVSHKRFPVGHPRFGRRDIGDMEVAHQRHTFRGIHSVPSHWNEDLFGFPNEVESVGVDL